MELAEVNLERIPYDEEWRINLGQGDDLVHMTNVEVQDLEIESAKVEFNDVQVKGSAEIDLQTQSWNTEFHRIVNSRFGDGLDLKANRGIDMTLENVDVTGDARDWWIAINADPLCTAGRS